MLQTAVMLLSLLLIQEELLCKHCKTTLIIAGWKGRTRSYHCCWWSSNWVIRKKRGEGELIVCCVVFLHNVWWPCYQPPLLDTTGVLLVIALCVSVLNRVKLEWWDRWDQW